jgi:hypothetical protein
MTFYEWLSNTTRRWVGEPCVGSKVAIVWSALDGDVYIVYGTIQSKSAGKCFTITVKTASGMVVKFDRITLRCINDQSIYLEFDVLNLQLLNFEENSSWVNFLF